MYGDCNSFAAAKLSGKLARILRKQPSNDNSKVKKLLRKESKLFVWTVPLLNLFKEYPVFRDNNIIYDPIKLNKLATNIAVFFSVENISDIYSYSLYSSKISQKKNSLIDSFAFWKKSMDLFVKIIAFLREMILYLYILYINS